jgi:predicted phage replisome organizer
MAKYNDTKFYWLQLKEDFFEDDAINWLEEQQPNGRDYAYFYLKLCLKSLKTNGILIRQVGNVLIPYDNKKLAELTRMDFDTVTVAMELLKQIGLVEILEGGEIYINQLENLIGSQSVGAFKKQQQRMLKNEGGGQMSSICPPKIEIELEKEKDIDINNKNIKHKYGEYQNVLLTDKEYQSLKKDYDNYEELIKYLDEYVEMKGYKAKSHYLCIKKWVVDAVKGNSKKNNRSFLDQLEEEWKKEGVI